MPSLPSCQRSRRRWQREQLVDAATPYMETQQIGTKSKRSLTDIVGLQNSGIFPVGREPSIRTLRTWTRLRRIPHHRVGHFVYYDLAEVESHIRTNLLIPAR